MHRLRWLYAILAVLVLGAVGYTVFWFHLKRQVEAGIAEWTAAHRAAGWQVAFSPPAVGGWPFRMVLDLASIELADPKHRQAWAFSLPAVKVVAQPWAPRHLIFLPRGPGRLTWGPDGARAGLEVEAADTKASLVLDPQGRALRLAVVGEQVAARLAYPRFEGTYQAGARHFELHARDNRGQAGAATAVDLALSAEDASGSLITLGPPYGRSIARLGVDLGLTGPLDAQSVERWRDDGGTVELRQLLLRWGPSELKANGTLALDKQMRPIGAMTAEVKGWEPMIDRMVESRQLPRGRGQAMKLAFALLAQPGPDGSKVLTAPISAQDGKLTIGPAAVADLPSLPLE